MSVAYPSDLAHLRGALLTLNLALHRQLLRQRSPQGEQAPGEASADTWLDDHQVDTVLDELYAAGAPPEADSWERAPLATLTQLLDDARRRHREHEQAALRAGVPLRLPALAERLTLNEFEQQVVLLTLASEFDQRYERLYVLIADDSGRRLPTVDLALQLFAADPAGRAAGRRSFAPAAPLRALRIVQLTDNQGADTLLAAQLRLDPHLASFLLGGDAPDPALDGRLRRYCQPLHPTLAAALPADVASLTRHLRQRPAPLLALDGPDHALLLAAAAWLSDGAPLLVLAQEPEQSDDALARAIREARLQDAALAVIGAPAERLQRFVDAVLDRPRFVVSSAPLDVPGVRLHVPALDATGRERLWHAALEGAALDVGDLAERFRLTADEIAAAARQARVQAEARGREVTRADVLSSCRAHSAHALAGLAQPVESNQTWDDLVLPAATKAHIRGIEHWVRHRHTVYQRWGFARRTPLGRGLAVLFSGASGTGKTLAAGIVAGSLELDLYRIDLATVVSKYIGETEKNLGRIFDAAERANAILFFDEADALFGKRSEVKDAHDRYANIEVSYLLQRMEAYEGVAILATNFRQNLDGAFVRRLHVIVEFPLPSAADRERIWRLLLPASVPQSADVDLAFLARQFALSGGNIRNCALAAAFGAAADDECVTMRHLVQAVARELDKTAQPVLRTAFGPYHALVRSGREREDACGDDR